MNTKSYEFRSKSQREKEVDLTRNYGAIGNKAVAAASQSCCKAKDAAKKAAKSVSKSNDDSQTRH